MTQQEKRFANNASLVQWYRKKSSNLFIFLPYFFSLKDTSGLVCFEGRRSAVYSALMSSDGELLYGVVDSAIFADYSFELVFIVQHHLIKLLGPIILSNLFS